MNALPTSPRAELEAPGSTERRRLDPSGMRVTPSVSVVIPALNEERNLPAVLEEVPPMVGEVVIVDGGSSDRTIEVARAVFPDALIIGQPGRGKGDAMRSGFAVCHGDAIVMLDADGSMSPGEIPNFVDELRSGAEFVKGSRFLPTAGSDDLTRLRRLGNSGLRVVFNTLYQVHHTDLCYGYLAFWRRCLPVLTFEVDGFELETILNIRSVQSGLTVREVPSYELSRRNGRSGLRVVHDGWRIMRVLLAEGRTGPEQAVIFSLDEHRRRSTRRRALLGTLVDELRAKVG